MWRDAITFADGGGLSGQPFSWPCVRAWLDERGLVGGEREFALMLVGACKDALSRGQAKQEGVDG